MALTETSKNKAATLLMNLDPTMACELLKGLSDDEIQDVVIMMAEIEASGRRDKKQQKKIIAEFSDSLRRSRSQLNRINWTNISYEARQFCRLLVELDYIDPNDRLAVRELIKIATNGIKELKEVYPEVALDFRERKDDNNLPQLKIKVSELKSKGSNKNIAPKKYSKTCKNP